MGWLFSTRRDPEDPHQLQIAVHELGHAWAWRDGGLEVGRIKHSGDDGACRVRYYPQASATTHSPNSCERSRSVAGPVSKLRTVGYVRTVSAAPAVATAVTTSACSALRCASWVADCPSPRLARRPAPSSCAAGHRSNAERRN